MIRKLSLAVAVATALSPLGAFALGLGDIHTHSALNQQFKADIDLLTVTREELPDIRVGLASPEAFSKAGIERLFLLSGLRFTPAVAPDGRMVIEVSSQDPIREPFLNFLLEVNWPKGRMLREYTVLLDPPVTLAREPAPIQAPRVSAATSRLSAAPVSSSPTVTRESYPASVSQAVGGREYGPIQLNDNLWVIAESMQHQGETVEQVMMALHRYNPDAFIRNNVNGLKVGRILRLPEDADVTGLSPREARREFLAQTKEWRDQRADTSVEAVAPQIAQEQAEPPTASETKDRLELIAAKPDAAEEAQAGEGKAESGSKVARLEQEVMLIREENESARQENEILQARIRKLEAQIGDIQRLLSLKSDQLAELQTTQQVVEEKTEALAAAQDEAPVVEAEAVLAEKLEAEPITPIETEGVIEQVDIESIVMEAMRSDEAPAEPIVAGIETPEPVKQEQPVITPPVEPVTSPPVIADSKQPATAEPVAAKRPVQDGLMDILTGNSTLMGLVGAVVVLLSSLLWLIMRRRREAEAEFAESILVTPEGEEIASTVQDSVGSVNESSEETSFMSDFSPSDIDALQDETGEVDPVSEADVYIAYGRYQQAEELIKQAIEKFPEREELKHKLLEIYYSAKNSTQYALVAEELQQAGLEKSQPDVWAKIARMGQELDPANTLFALATGAAIGIGLETVGEDQDELDLDLNSELLDGEAAPSAAGIEEPVLESAENESSMDLSDLVSLDEPDSESIESNMTLDSEFLNSLDEELNPVADQQHEESDALNIDLVAMEDVSEPESQAEDENLDFSSALDGLSELSSLDLSPSNDVEQEVKDESNVIGLENAESFDDFDLESLEKELEMLSGDLEEKVDEESTTDELKLPEELNAQAEVVDLGSTDEVTTKLDLAHAYVDMGDAEGAKHILEEVVTEGSDTQKQQAQELLGMLAS